MGVRETQSIQWNQEGTQREEEPLLNLCHQRRDLLHQEA